MPVFIVKEWSKIPIVHELSVSCTVIAISKDRLALIVQRPPNKSFPLKWTVAGGKIKVGDGERVSDTFFYHPAEYCACREFYEETGIPISSSGLYYLDSIYSADTDRLILSFYVIINENAKNIPIKLDECQDYKWISEDQIKDFDFIPDIGGEIKEVFKRLPRR
jgi:8-oxo-dGTP pyrophosphatase MutT (NUDIX family)